MRDARGRLVLLHEVRDADLPPDGQDLANNLRVQYASVSELVASLRHDESAAVLASDAVYPMTRAVQVLYGRDLR